MSDDPLRELLQSPLDDLRPRRRLPGLSVLLFLAAVAIGIGLGWGGWTVLDSEGPVAISTTTSTTTTTVVERGEIRWEATGSFELEGNTFVTAATVAEPGVVATRIDAPWTARWAIQIDNGLSVDFFEEYQWPNAPGVFTVRFPNLDLARGADLFAYPVASEEAGELSLSLDAADFPWTGPLEQDRLAVGGATVVIDSIRLDDGGGFLEWHVEGNPHARAWLTAEMSYREPDAIEPERTVSGDFFADDERPERPFGAPEREGTLEMWHLDGTVLGGDPDLEVTVSEVQLLLTATVYFYAEDAVAITIPAGGGS